MGDYVEESPPSLDKYDYNAHPNKEMPMFEAEDESMEMDDIEHGDTEKSAGDTISTNKGIINEVSFHQSEDSPTKQPVCTPPGGRMTLRTKQQAVKYDDCREDFTDANGYEWRYMRDFAPNEDLDQMRNEKNLTFSYRSEARVLLRCKRFRKSKTYASCSYKILLIGNPAKQRRMFECKKHNHANINGRILHAFPVHQNFTNQNGVVWTFVALGEKGKYEEFVRNQQCTSNGTKGNSTYFRCHGNTKTCSFKMLLRHDPIDGILKLYQKGEHNHELPTSFSSASFSKQAQPQEEQTYLDKNGKNWTLFRTIHSEEDLEQVRREQNLWKGSDNDTTKSFRCANHAPRRGSCPFRVILFEENGAYSMYSREEHNHVVVPSATIGSVPIVFSNKTILSEKSVVAQEFDESCDLYIKKDYSHSTSAKRREKTNLKRSMSVPVNNKKHQNVPEFKDREGHIWDYFCIIEGYGEMERTRRAQQVVCKGRKANSRYFRCQLYVNGTNNCPFRLASVENPPGFFTIYTDNSHNHEVVPIDESAPSRHSLARFLDHANSGVDANHNAFAARQSRFSKEELDFNLADVFEYLQQLAADLLLTIQNELPNSLLLMSREVELHSQVLAFTDDEDSITVEEFHDQNCVRRDIWPKGGVNQFISAVRGKCFEFFFDTPLSVSRRNEITHDGA